MNKNTIPGDPQSPFVTSGIRLGTPAVTTRGFREPEMARVAELIDEVLTRKDDATLARVKSEVRALTDAYPALRRTGPRGGGGRPGAMTGATVPPNVEVDAGVGSIDAAFPPVHHPACCWSSRRSPTRSCRSWTS